LQKLTGCNRHGVVGTDNCIRDRQFIFYKPLFHGFYCRLFPEIPVCNTAVLLRQPVFLQDFLKCGDPFIGKIIFCKSGKHEQRSGVVDFHHMAAEFFKRVGIVEPEIDAALQSLIDRQHWDLPAAAVLQNVIQNGISVNGIRKEDHCVQQIIGDQLVYSHLAEVCRGRRQKKVGFCIEYKKAVSFCRSMLIECFDTLQSVFFLYAGKTYTNDACRFLHGQSLLSVNSKIVKMKHEIALGICWKCTRNA